MSLLCIEGVYKDGKVELAERPQGVGEQTRVIVTFLADPDDREPTQVGPTPEEKARTEAGRRLMAIFREGIPLGGPPYPKREELYDRTYRFDGTRDG